MAVATPTILPVPIVAASEVAKAANWLTSPVEPLSLVKESLIAFISFLWGNFNLKVRKICVPNNSTTIGQPQRAPAICDTIELIESEVIIVWFLS
jgi:hypothetical protein